MPIPLGPVVYSIYVNGTLATETPLDVTLEQCWGEHEMFSVRIEYPRTFVGIPSMSFWADNATVRILWGRRPDNLHTWYGYVNHHNVKGNADSGSKALQVTYYLLGTSKPMNSDKTRTWGNTTPTYIARKIASEYGFRTVVTSTNWILPYEVQANESDFCFLNRVADKVGFRFWVSGGTLYFIDPAVILSGSSDISVPRYTMDKRFDQVDTVVNFDMNQGDNLPGAEKAIRSIYGVDPGSGRVFQVSAANVAPSATQHTMTGWPATSVAEAQNIVNAWQSRSQFFISAKAELFGDILIYPGKLVHLSGLQMPKDGTGLWLVTAARHILKVSGTTLTTSDKFVTQVELVRNSGNITPNIKNVSKISPEFVQCDIHQGHWRSRNTAVLYDGVEKV
jgi:hypothetical protein